MIHVDVVAPKARRPFLLRVFTPKFVLGTGLLLILLVALLARMSSSDYIFLPDRAHPVGPLVHVAGGHNPDNGGGIYFVDVIVRPATVLEQLFGGLHAGADLYPADEIVPPGVSTAQENQVDSYEMATSQQIAAAVALRELGKKVTISQSGALIDAVETGFPAAGKLAPTDVIVAIDGRPVRSPAGVSALMAGKRAGTSFRFTILHDGRRRVVALRTVPVKPGSKPRRRRDLPRPEPGRDDPPADPRLDRRARDRRPLGRARLRARRAPAARPERRPRLQDRRHGRDLPERPGRPDRRDQAEDDRRA